MVTVYGRVTEIEPTVPGGPPVEPPPEPLTREGEPPEPAKTWVHVHVVLDPPSSGEVEFNAPEHHVSGLLTVDGRCRVMPAEV
jgi:hypothetical protein